MIIDNQTPLYTSEEIDLIKSYWNEETSEKRIFEDRSYTFNVLYDLPEEYTNRFLDWIEDTIGKKLLNREYHLILHKFKEGDYFDWHEDNAYMERGKREYAVGFHLNDDYNGGEFVVIEDGKEKIIGKVPGSPYLFTSDVTHKINRVESGIRWSIILFVYDTSFKAKSVI